VLRNRQLTIPPTIREKNDLEQWYKFFLVGVIETAKNEIVTFDNILQLQKQIDIDIQSLGSRALKAKKVIKIPFFCCNSYYNM